MARLKITYKQGYQNTNEGVKEKKPAKVETHCTGGLPTRLTPRAELHSFFSISKVCPMHTASIAHAHRTQHEGDPHMSHTSLQTWLNPGRRYIIHLSVCLLFLFPLCNSAPAEEISSPPAPSHYKKVHTFTIQDLVRIALDASPDIWAEHYSVKKAEAQLGQAKAGRLPRLEAMNILGPVPSAHGDAVYSPNDRDDLLYNLGFFTRLEITVNQPLFTFGQLQAHIQAAVEGLEAKRAGIQRSRGEIIRTVKELYFTLQLNYELFDLVSDTAEQFAKAISKAEELLEESSGTITQQDLLKLRYGNIRASTELLEIEKGKDLVHSALKRLLYLPQEEDFDLLEKRLIPEKTQLDALEAYVKLARKNRAEWKQLEAGIRAKAAELKAEERLYFPNIFVSGFFRFAAAPNRDKQDNPFVVEDFNYLVGGVVLGWRYAIDFGVPARIREKQAELYQLLQQEHGAQSGLLLEVEKAYKDAEERKEVLNLAIQARKNGRALATTSAASFQLGLGEAKDVFEALKIYAESAAQYYLAIKDYNVAIAELSRVTGTEVVSGGEMGNGKGGGV